MAWVLTGMKEVWACCHLLLQLGQKDSLPVSNYCPSFSTARSCILLTHVVGRAASSTGTSPSLVFVSREPHGPQAKQIAGYGYCHHPGYSTAQAKCLLPSAWERGAKNPGCLDGCQWDVLAPAPRWHKVLAGLQLGSGWVGQNEICLFSVFSLVGFLGRSYAYVNFSSLCSPAFVVFPAELTLLLLNDFFSSLLFLFSSMKWG